MLCEVTIQEVTKQGIHFRGCGIVPQIDEVALTKMAALGFVRRGLISLDKF